MFAGRYDVKKMTKRAFEALPSYPPVTHDWDEVRQRLAAGEHTSSASG